MVSPSWEEQKSAEESCKETGHRFASRNFEDMLLRCSTPREVLDIEQAPELSIVSGIVYNI